MDLKSINNAKLEIYSLVNRIFDRMDEVDHKSYALFMSQAYYEPMYLSLPAHVPYATEERYSQYVDETRLTFFCKYMNHYEQLSDMGNMDADSIIYEIGIQLMLYVHIWESRSFLIRMIEIFSIIGKHEYMWINGFPKGSKNNLIKQRVLDLLDEVDKPISDFVKKCYDAELRNSFAHSSFTIDVEAEEIVPLEPTHCYPMTEKKITFEEWKNTFVSLAFFSYYLPIVMNERRKTLFDELRKKPLLYTLPLNPDNPKGGKVELWLGADMPGGYPEFIFYKKGT